MLLKALTRDIYTVTSSHSCTCYTLESLVSTKMQLSISLDNCTNTSLLVFAAIQILGHLDEGADQAFLSNEKVRGNVIGQPTAACASRDWHRAETVASWFFRLPVSCDKFWNKASLCSASFFLCSSWACSDATT